MASNFLEDPFYTTQSSTSSATSNSPSLESLPDLSNQSASRDQRNQTIHIRSSDNQRILYFTSLRELLADLLERNEASYSRFSLKKIKKNCCFINMSSQNGCYFLATFYFTHIFYFRN